MTTITSPWERHQLSPIPDPCTATVLRLLTPEEFDAVLRSNLMPGEDRFGYEELWQLLAFNDDLAERCFDSLEAWLNLCDEQPDDHPDAGRIVKFRRMCDQAWNRLTKIRNVDVRPGPARPAAHTVGGQFALAIAAHRQQLGDSTTALDDSLWAAAKHARERARRSRETTPGWHRAPVFTTQLIDAVEEHRRLNGAPRQVDAVLYGLLRG